jgi:hypothetical protein
MSAADIIEHLRNHEDGMGRGEQPGAKRLDREYFFALPVGLQSAAPMEAVPNVDTYGIFTLPACALARRFAWAGRLEPYHGVDNGTL